MVCIRDVASPHFGTAALASAPAGAPSPAGGAPAEGQARGPYVFSASEEAAVRTAFEADGFMFTRVVLPK